ESTREWVVAAHHFEWRAAGTRETRTIDAQVHDDGDTADPVRDLVVELLWRVVGEVDGVEQRLADEPVPAGRRVHAAEAPLPARRQFATQRLRRLPRAVLALDGAEHVDVGVAVVAVLRD